MSNTVAQAIQAAKEQVKAGHASWDNLCLKFVANMYGFPASGTPHPAGQDAPYAIDAWNANPSKHPGDENPPPGALVFWNGKPGHVALSIGNGQVISTHKGARAGVYNLGDVNVGSYLGWTTPAFGAGNYHAPADFGSNVSNPRFPGAAATFGTIGGPTTVTSSPSGVGAVSDPTIADQVSQWIAAANPISGIVAFLSEINWLTLPTSWIRIQAALAGFAWLIIAIILFAWEGASRG